MDYPILKKLQDEIAFLESLSQDESVLIQIGDMSMHIESAALLREKNEEMEMLDNYIEGLDSEKKELEKVTKRIKHLQSLDFNYDNQDIIELYHQGVAFEFNPHKLLESLLKEKKAIESYIDELNTYLTTGKQTY